MQINHLFLSETAKHMNNVNRAKSKTKLDKFVAKPISAKNEKKIWKKNYNLTVYINYNLTAQLL